MQKIFSQSVGAVVLLLIMFPGFAAAESARSLVESGNKAFAQGDYAKSLESYEKAAQVEPDAAVILFNRGTALYKQNNYAEAFNLFEQAAQKALEENDPVLEAQSRYNMGNSSYRKAEAMSRENLEAAYDEYKRSGEYFQSAIKLDPGLTDAAHNLEVSRIAAKQVEELLRQQQQQAQQQPPADQAQDESGSQDQEARKEGETQQQQEATDGEQEQPPEEAARTAKTPLGESPEDIINEEIESRKYRQGDSVTGYKPVDKDW